MNEANGRKGVAEGGELPWLGTTIKFVVLVHVPDQTQVQLGDQVSLILTTSFSIFKHNSNPIRYVKEVFDVTFTDLNKPVTVHPVYDQI